MCELFVLIVPLWNWNVEAVVAFSLISGFNRTFMELKLFWNSAIDLSLSGFNRTFMELKFPLLERMPLDFEF